MVEQAPFLLEAAC